MHTNSVDQHIADLNYYFPSVLALDPFFINFKSFKFVPIPIKYFMMLFFFLTRIIFCFYCYYYFYCVHLTLSLDEQILRKIKY